MLSARDMLASDPSREEKALATQILVSSLLVKASLQEKEDRLPEALGTYTDALRAAPPGGRQSAALHAKMAMILERLNRPQDAARHRAEAMRIGRSLQPGN